MRLEKCSSFRLETESSHDEINEAINITKEMLHSDRKMCPSMKRLDQGFSSINTKMTIDDFDILKILGEGSFGKVMLIRRKYDGTFYALKSLNKCAIVSSCQVEHTKSERKYFY